MTHIELKDIRKEFGGSVVAVKNLNLTIEHGEFLVLVGPSGCGKTTLGRVLLGLIPITDGSVFYDGEDIRAIPDRELRRRMQIVFQDPGGSMNPRMSVRSIVGEPLQVNRLAEGAELTQKVADVLDSVGLKREHMNRFPHEFSGGQKQRLALARALSLDPEFILLDEPTSALDVSVQAQVLNLLEEIQEKLGLTFVFITHALNVVNHISDRVAVMYLGKIVEIANTADLFDKPAHPYTHALMSAIPEPSLEKASRERIVLSGDVPSPADPPPGCRFHTRCPIAVEGVCDVVDPPLETIDFDDHAVACHFPLGPGMRLPVVGDNQTQSGDDDGPATVVL